MSRAIKDLVRNTTPNVVRAKERKVRNRAERARRYAAQAQEQGITVQELRHRLFVEAQRFVIRRPPMPDWCYDRYRY